MKIFIDEKVFNQAIKRNKLELAEWLLEQNCPHDSSCYFQNFDIKVLDWLKFKGVPVNTVSMSIVVKNCDSEEVIRWFISNGVEINTETINTCIKLKDVSFVLDFIQKYNVKLSSENYEIAILTENIPVLNLLKQSNCPFDEKLVEIALKYCKKKSVKWLVQNDLI
jgi:hypothetical protein